jgi:hypothetical protein
MDPNPGHREKGGRYLNSEMCTSYITLHPSFHNIVSRCCSAYRNQNPQCSLLHPIDRLSRLTSARGVLGVRPVCWDLLPSQLYHMQLEQSPTVGTNSSLNLLFCCWPLQEQMLRCGAESHGDNGTILGAEAESAVFSLAKWKRSSQGSEAD